MQDWLSFRNTELHGLSEAQLIKVWLLATVWEFCVQVAAMLRFALLQVDQRLQCKVYLVGHSVSLADLVLFATLYRALVRHMDFDNLSII